MTTYAAYRHIELDKIGTGKKRVTNPSSDIFNVLCSPQSQPTSPQNGSITPRRSLSHNDSFNRLFGSSSTPSRKPSFTKHDASGRNPVTGSGVTSWDQRRNSFSPRARKERNPVTGEYNAIVSPATTPTKLEQNGFGLKNGFKTPEQNGFTADIKADILTNGEA